MSPILSLINNFKGIIASLLRIMSRCAVKAKLIIIITTNNICFLLSDGHKILWKAHELEENGITHVQSDGVLRVNKSGLYFVSSQIALKPESSGAILRHRIVLVSQGRDDRIVLEGSKTTCNSFRSDGKLTSSLGTALNLEMNEELFVVTSHGIWLAEQDNQDEQHHFTIHSYN